MKLGKALLGMCLAWGAFVVCGVAIVKYADYISLHGTSGDAHGLLRGVLNVSALAVAASFARSCMRKRKLLAVMQAIAALVLLLAYAVCSAAAMNFYYDRQPHQSPLDSADKCGNVQLSNIQYPLSNNQYQYQYPIFSGNGWMEPEFLDFMIPEFATKADMSIDAVLASLEQTMNLSFGTGMVDNRFVEIQYITTIDHLMPLPKMTWTYATVRTILADIAKADRLQPRCYWNPTYRRITFLGPLEWLSEEQEQWRDFVAEAGYPVSLENVQLSNNQYPVSNNQ